MTDTTSELRVVGIDPGDIHVGFTYYDGDPARTMLESEELRPKEACRRLKRMLYYQQVDEVVIEEFRLYDREYENQAWSPFLTCQLIGALKWIVDEYMDMRTELMGEVVVIEQSATHKRAVRAQMPARGLKHAPGVIHTRDAELHAWKRILNNRINGRSRT